MQTISSSSSFIIVLDFLVTGIPVVSAVSSKVLFLWSPPEDITEKIMNDT